MKTLLVKYFSGENAASNGWCTCRPEKRFQAHDFEKSVAPCMVKRMLPLTEINSPAKLFGTRSHGVRSLAMMGMLKAPMRIREYRTFLIKTHPKHLLNHVAILVGRRHPGSVVIPF
jgi:hypothetical protein